MYDSLVTWNNIYKKYTRPGSADSETIIRRQTHMAVNIGVALLVICYLIGNINKRSETPKPKDKKRYLGPPI